ncbi:hypothetical protein ACS0PU_010298 [Formica fusca]
MDYLTSQATVKNCIGWTFSPLVAVGSPVGNLLTTPANEDCASRVGCKQQSFTSWDCLSRSYIGGAVVIENPGDGTDAKSRTTRSVKEHLPKPDIPTEEELQQLDPMDRSMYKRGMRVYSRKHGLLTQAQFERVHRLRHHQPVPTTQKVSSTEEPSTKYQGLWNSVQI